MVYKRLFSRGFFRGAVLLLWILSLIFILLWPPMSFFVDEEYKYPVKHLFLLNPGFQGYAIVYEVLFFEAAAICIAVAWLFWLFPQRKRE